jgi:hypothetical protein
LAQFARLDIDKLTCRPDDESFSSRWNTGVSFYISPPNTCLALPAAQALFDQLTSTIPIPLKQPLTVAWLFC